MKKILSLALSLALSSLGVVGLAASAARAQQVASAGNSVERLRAEYERLLAVDRDPSTSPAVREVNRRFLEERRAQLRAAVEKSLNDLRDYQTAMSGTLSAEEKLVVRNSVQALERDLSALAGDADGAATAMRPAPRRASRRTRTQPAAGEQSPAFVGSTTEEQFTTVNASAVTAGREPAEASPAPTKAAPAPANAAAPAPPVNPLAAFPGTISFNTTPKTAATATAAAVFDTADVNLKLSFTAPVNEIEVSVDNGGKAVAQPKSKYPVLSTESATGSSKDDVYVKLGEGDNTITVTVTNPAGKYDPGTIHATYTNPFASAAAPAPNPTPATPRFDFIEAGKSNIIILDTVNGATVKLYRNGEDLATTTAHGESVLIRSPHAAEIGDHFEADQTEGDKTSLRGRFTVTEGALDPTEGGPFAVAVGGAVMSQQADAFQQADPFFGFLAGYSSKVKNRYKKMQQCGGASFLEMFDGSFSDADGYKVLCKRDGKLYYTTDGVNYDSANRPANAMRNTVTKPAVSTSPWAWRWNLRFQGIFQSDPRKAVATETAAGATPTPTPTPAPTPVADVTGKNCPNNEPCFIASRKTFDIEMHGWIDLWANNAFSIGPYAAVGASTTLDDNELQGEATPNPNAQGGGNNSAITNAVSSNDLKKYFEGGFLSNILLFDKKLFVQSIVAYGNYEALDGLYKGANTKHRFVGKLRVFPSGLNRGFGRQIEAAPMFGVDLNAGRGPDHIKFYTGFAIALKGFNIASK